MNRRKFLLGSATTLTGSGLLVGTQGTSSVESKREVTFQVAGDEDAYLGIEYPEGVDIDCNGVVRITLKNQAKEDFTFVDFEYSLVDGDKISIDNVNEPNNIDLGSAEDVEIDVSCNSNSTVPDGIFEFGVTVEGDTSEIDTNGSSREIELDCTDTGCLNSPEGSPDPSNLTAISFIAFCGGETDLSPGDISVDTIESNSDGEPVRVDWSTSKSVDEVILKGGQEWYLYKVHGATSGFAQMSMGPADEFASGNTVEFPSDNGSGNVSRCPSSPCYDEQGVKVEYSGGSFDNTESTNKQC